MTPMPDVLERIEERLAAATPGPWVVQSPSDGVDPTDHYIDTHAWPDGPEPVVCRSYGPDPADAAFIATARNLFPELLAVVRAAEERQHAEQETKDAVQALLACRHDEDGCEHITRSLAASDRYAASLTGLDAALAAFRSAAEQEVPDHD